ncbi:MAG: cell wall surface anchor family protein [uncultured Paraburkholderia sp.]|nr:MAG: cell wall surface anchor family protein [uncultured Paraburkholderia sp.]
MASAAVSAMRQCGLEKFQWHLTSGAGARSPATTAFFSMADSAVSKQSRPRRAASKKRREATVSTETEKKLARAARSAQRLAQLSDVSRDDSTLDLFPDDPTRATLEAMNIDILQGTLHGFELPDVVLAAVGALDASAEGASPDARAARRAPRAPTAEEPGATPAQLSGLLEIEPPTAAGADASQASLIADSADDDKAPVLPLTPAMAAATVARSVTALRQAAERRECESGGSWCVRSQRQAVASVGFKRGRRTGDGEPGGCAGGIGYGRAQRIGRARPERTLAGGAASSAAADARAGRKGASANLRGWGEVARPSAGASVAQMSTSQTVDAAGQGGTPSASASAGEIPALTVEAAVPPARLSASASAGETSPSTTVSAAGQVVKPSASAAAAKTLPSTTAPTVPELDRATAFADTVDALYGVIADQRRAASDHSRRMKWMLSVVVGALLMTVAIGITQTMLLMRLHARPLRSSIACKK